MKILAVVAVLLLLLSACEPEKTAKVKHLDFGDSVTLGDYKIKAAKPILDKEAKKVSIRVTITNRAGMKVEIRPLTGLSTSKGNAVLVESPNSIRLAKGKTTTVTYKYRVQDMKGIEFRFRPNYNDPQATFD